MEEKNILMRFMEKEDTNKLAREVGDMTIDEVGHDYIKKLDILKDDFNYSP